MMNVQNIFLIKSLFKIECICFFKKNDKYLPRD